VAAIAVGVAALRCGETAIGIVGVTLLILRRGECACGERATGGAAVGPRPRQPVLLVIAEMLIVGAYLLQALRASHAAHRVIEWTTPVPVGSETVLRHIALISLIPETQHIHPTQNSKSDYSSG